jgi:hypothetical protein
MFPANIQTAPARVVGLVARRGRANGPKDLLSLAIADHLYRGGSAVVRQREALTES